MNGIFLKAALDHYLVGPVQKKLLFTLTREQKIIGAIALALFSLITIASYLYKNLKMHSVALLVNNETDFTPPAMTLVGIPNFGDTCYINSTAMALYPLREHLSHLNSPPLKVIQETYGNPVSKASDLVLVLKELYEKSAGAGGGGDCCELMALLLEKIIEEDPRLKDLFCGFVKPLNCDPCSRTSHAVEIPVFSSDYGSEAFSLNHYLCCGACNGMCGTAMDLTLPKYCFVDISVNDGMLLKEQFEWHGIEFKVISAVKYGGGHFSCVIKKEDGNWYHFDDERVNPINPFDQSGYRYMILEKITNGKNE